MGNYIKKISFKYNVILNINRIMPEINTTLLEKINKNLQLLIYLTLRNNEISEMTTGEQFFMLNRLGFSDNVIANLFGKTRGYVSSELVKQKKRINK